MHLWGSLELLCNPLRPLEASLRPPETFWDNFETRWNASETSRYLLKYPGTPLNTLDISWSPGTLLKNPWDFRNFHGTPETHWSIPEDPWNLLRYPETTLRPMKRPETRWIPLKPPETALKLLLMPLIFYITPWKHLGHSKSPLRSPGTPWNHWFISSVRKSIIVAVSQPSIYRISVEHSSSTHH